MAFCNILYHRNRRWISEGLLCVIISSIYLCVSVCLSAPFEPYEYTSADMHAALSVQMCISSCTRAQQSISVCHALHLPSPVAPFVLPPAASLWPHAAICFFDYLFNVCCHNQLQSLWPATSDPSSHCLFGTRRIKSKWPRLFIFPPPVSDHICTLHTGPCLYAHPWSKIRQRKWILQRNS